MKSILASSLILLLAACSSGVDSTSGSGGSTGQPGTGGSGGDSDPCDYMVFPDHLCGAGEPGVCAALPLDCGGATPGEVCGCDGQVHMSACVAAFDGQDVSGNGGCEAPQGKYACGQFFCVIGQQYCNTLLPLNPGDPPSHYCVPYPPECQPYPDCQCISQSFVVACSAGETGEVFVTQTQ